MMTSGSGIVMPRRAAETQNGSVVAHALVRLAVRQRPEPGSIHVHLPDFFVIRQPPQAAAPFCRHNTGGMIGKTGED